MAAASKKKLVQQEELRRLMKVKQRETAIKKRIESPFAKYNSLGHLSCVVCSVQIKSELLWQTHILGKQHKEKVSGLKGTKVNTSSSSVSEQTSHAAKRKGPVPEYKESKRTKDSGAQSSSTVPPGFFENIDNHQPSPKKAAVNVPDLKLLPGIYDDDDDAEEVNVGETKNVSTKLPSATQKPAEIPLPPPTASDSSLPGDFFETQIPLVSHSGSVLKADIQEKPMERKENTAEALPEGFFDDPEVDAKVRKVDAPKDQMDKEWEEFQKEMRQVNTVSEAIVAEEDEEGRLDRQIDEIDEQIECYRRIEDLRNRKDILHDKLMEVMRLNTYKEDVEDIGTDEEEMLPIMLAHNWREKGALL